MGQVYSVELRLICHDEKKLLEMAQRYMKETSAVVTYPKKTDFSSVDSMVKVFFTNNTEKTACGLYLSDFSASYGWESVMTEFFEYVAPALEDGSSITIWPDSDYDKLVVKDKKARWIH